MENLESVGIQNPVEEWEDLARDRRTWRGLVQEVMGLHEAWEPTEWVWVSELLLDSKLLVTFVDKHMQTKYA